MSRAVRSSRSTVTEGTGDKGGEKQQDQDKTKDGDRMTFEMTQEQLQELIRGVLAGAGGGAAGAAGPMAAAAMVGPTGPCTLGKDNLKRPKRWADWHREAEMRR